MERLTISGVNIGAIPNKELPSYESLYEKLRKYEESFYVLSEVVKREEDYFSILSELAKIFVVECKQKVKEKLPVEKKARFLTYEACEEWEKYKEDKENGLLVRLPCKVGGTIWVIGVMGNPQAEPFEVICMTYRIDKQEDNGVYVYAVGNGRISFFLNDELGKSVFLTRAEAESKLKRNGG